MNAEEKRPEGADEHVIHMWEPFSFETPRGYDYRRDAFWKDFGSTLFRWFADVVLEVLDRVYYGLKITGMKNLRRLGGSGAVCICNHVHVMDCTFVELALKSRLVYYVTLESNFRIPGVRKLIRALRGVPLSPKAHPMAELFREMGRAIDDGALVQIYPEGVLIPYCPELRTFHDGAFHLAVTNGVPVLPMVVTFRPTRGLRRLWRKAPSVNLRILPPVSAPEELPRREAVQWLNTTCKRAMQHILDAARQDAP